MGSDERDRGGSGSRGSLTKKERGGKGTSVSVQGSGLPEEGKENQALPLVADKVKKTGARKGEDKRGPNR